MFGAVLFVRDNQRRFPGRKAHKISMEHFEHSPGSGFDLEWLVFRNQLFNQRRVHSIQMLLLRVCAAIPAVKGNYSGRLEIGCSGACAKH